MGLQTADTNYKHEVTEGEFHLLLNKIYFAYEYDEYSYHHIS